MPSTRTSSGPKAGRAILESKSNMVIVADKASSLEKLERYIDMETLEAMGVPAAAGRTPADGLRPPTLGAIAARDTFTSTSWRSPAMSRIAMSGSKQNGVFDKHYPEADVWIGEQGYRALETEYKRINEYFQLARTDSDEEWPVPERRAHPLARRAKQARDPFRSHQS